MCCLDRGLTLRQSAELVTDANSVFFQHNTKIGKLGLISGWVGFCLFVCLSGGEREELIDGQVDRLLSGLFGG